MNSILLIIPLSVSCTFMQQFCIIAAYD